MNTQTIIGLIDPTCLANENCKCRQLKENNRQDVQILSEAFGIPTYLDERKAALDKENALDEIGFRLLHLGRMISLMADSPDLDAGTRAAFKGIEDSVEACRAFANPEIVID